MDRGRFGEAGREAALGVEEWPDVFEEVESWDGLAGGELSPVLQEVAEQTSYGEVFLHDLIRRQRRLALSVAGVFLVFLFGLPLANIAVPGLMMLPIFGLPMAWFILAIGIYPLLWGLALYFTATAGALEDQFLDLVR